MAQGGGNAIKKLFKDDKKIIGKNSTVSNSLFKLGDDWLMDRLQTSFAIHFVFATVEILKLFTNLLAHFYQLPEHIRQKTFFIIIAQKLSHLTPLFSNRFVQSAMHDKHILLINYESFTSDRVITRFRKSYDFHAMLVLIGYLHQILCKNIVFCTISADGNLNAAKFELFQSLRRLIQINLNAFNFENLLNFWIKLLAQATQNIQCTTLYGNYPCNNLYKLHEEIKNSMLLHGHRQNKYHIFDNNCKEEIGHLMKTLQVQIDDDKLFKKPPRVVNKSVMDLVKENLYSEDIPYLNKEDEDDETPLGVIEKGFIVEKKKPKIIERRESLSGKTTTVTDFSKKLFYSKVVAGETAQKEANKSNKPEINVNITKKSYPPGGNYTSGTITKCEKSPEKKQPNVTDKLMKQPQAQAPTKNDDVFETQTTKIYEPAVLHSNQKKPKERQQQEASFACAKTSPDRQKHESITEESSNLTTKSNMEKPFDNNNDNVNDVANDNFGPNIKQTYAQKAKSKKKSYPPGGNYTSSTITKCEKSPEKKQLNATYKFKKQSQAPAENMTKNDNVFKTQMKETFKPVVSHSKQKKPKERQKQLEAISAGTKTSPNRQKHESIAEESSDIVTKSNTEKTSDNSDDNNNDGQDIIQTNAPKTKSKRKRRRKRNKQSSKVATSTSEQNDDDDDDDLKVNDENNGIYGYAKRLKDTYCNIL